MSQFRFVHHAQDHPRQLITVANAASRGFPAVLVTVPRRSGKTTLLRLMRPNADYRLLEDPDTLAQVHDDPRGFLDGLRFPTIRRWANRCGNSWARQRRMNAKAGLSIPGPILSDSAVLAKVFALARPIPSQPRSSG
jgi:hypothetical protein